MLRRVNEKNGFGSEYYCWESINGTLLISNYVVGKLGIITVPGAS
ncbi:hypothetical protein KP509_19G064400 [Ceratopteris richardii]|uniref:Uncharacterized protein n=1 Tax=Ceratopteris richardii TaxID=49495 RepID=A0A8T2SL50_CERRI|nr:hypothetical protein KP509_19G064400 [Ceratopteris richardii]